MNSFEISSPAHLWDWLEQNHDSAESWRLITWKVAQRAKYVSREQVLDALIAYGWIDGRRFVVDDKRTAQLISRRKQQAWAQSYKDRVERLRTQGQMQPSGEAAVAESKRLGLWDFYADVDALIVPQDLAESLNHAAWEQLAPSYRRNVLRWIKVAKTPATRAKRILTAVQATEGGRKIPQM